jgi:histidyl-tRNA synthetase
MARKIIKPQPISGFPEYTPAVHRVWQKWCDHMRAVFERYGFCGIETPAVEALEVIAAKGEVDKEIYVLERLHREEGGREARLGLRFDQTVPLARYVAQHFNDLDFPFKRYQIGRVWRGDRPQAGRFREFTQADIDIIGVDNLPLSFDAELAAIMYEVLSGLPGMEGQEFEIQVSNRNILTGFMGAIGINDENKIKNIIKNIDNIGKEKNTENKIFEIIGNKKIYDTFSEFMNDFYSDSFSSYEYIEECLAKYFSVIKLRDSNIGYLQFERGIKELVFVMRELSDFRGSVVADMSIVRGLDYYTGTVYETFLTGAPELGSICSGGRYDDLAGAYIAKSLPGVGLSIGVSRLFSHLLATGALDAHIGRVSPAEVLVALPSEEHRRAAQAAARALRKNGINTEVYHAPHKIGRQIAYAEKRGVPHVWFPDAGRQSVKCLATGVQAPADPATWAPPT